jgi:hypothetical protein
VYLLKVGWALPVHADGLMLNAWLVGCVFACVIVCVFINVLTHVLEVLRRG